MLNYKLLFINTNTQRQGVYLNDKHIIEYINTLRGVCKKYLKYKKLIKLRT